MKSKISVRPKDKALRRHKDTLYIQGVPNDTKDAFKAAAYRHGKTMRDVVIEFMREYASKTAASVRR